KTLLSGHFQVGSCCCAIAGATTATVAVSRKGIDVFIVDLLVPVLTDLIDRFDYYSRPVSQNLGHAVHDFVRVVAHAYHSVRPNLAGMLDHNFECFRASDFTQSGECGDVAADNSVQRPAQSPEDRARTHGDPAHDAKRANYSKSVERESCCHHVMREPVALR